MPPGEAAGHADLLNRARPAAVTQRRPPSSTIEKGPAEHAQRLVGHVPFFEPVPPEEEAPPLHRAWTPPAWDRPSEGVLGTIVPAPSIIGRTDEVALALDHVRAYPTGFVTALRIMPNPKRQIEPQSFFGPRRLPRVGVEFSDGRRAVTETDPARPGSLLPASGEADIGADGLPTHPVLRFAGIGGGMNILEFHVWVHPLPPVGDVKVYVEWQRVGIAETHVVVDAGVISGAAERAVVVWE